VSRYGSTAQRWYTTRESVKSAVGLVGAEYDALIDSYIEAASEDIEVMLNRRFIPETATKLYRWPQRKGFRSSQYYTGQVLLLEDEDLLAVTTLLAQAQDTTPVTIAAADYFLEPNNLGPPYTRIEIDLSSSAAFSGGDTPQRSISVAGRWGYSETTKAAGALAEADDGAETALDVTDSSLIGIGDTILVGSEAMFVSAKALLDTTANTSGTLAADSSIVTVAVNTGSLVLAGEVITINSERMLVESISGNNLTVKRAVDGSVLASHADAQDVYAPRTLTVARAVNGTTAATHSTAAAISKYMPPGDIVDLCRAMAIGHFKQGQSGWTGAISGGEGAIAVKMTDLFYLRERASEKYERVSL